MPDKFTTETLVLPWLKPLPRSLSLPEPQNPVRNSGNSAKNPVRPASTRDDLGRDPVRFRIASGSDAGGCSIRMGCVPVEASPLGRGAARDTSEDTPQTCPGDRTHTTDTVTHSDPGQTHEDVVERPKSILKYRNSTPAAIGQMYALYT